METFSAPSRQPSALLGLVLALLLPLGALLPSGRAATIDAVNPAPNLWFTGYYSNNTTMYTIGNTSTAYATSSFSTICYTNDANGDPTVPFAQVTFSSTNSFEGAFDFVSSGTAINASTGYYNGVNPTFQDAGMFTSGAVSGVNNYLPIEAIDSQGQAHYGWMEFGLYAFQANGPALIYEGGFINDVPNAAVVAGAVPEPSVYASLLGGLSLLGLALRRRMVA